MVHHLIQIYFSNLKSKPKNVYRNNFISHKNIITKNLTMFCVYPRSNTNIAAPIFLRTSKNYVNSSTIKKAAEKCIGAGCKNIPLTQNEAAITTIIPSQSTTGNASQQLTVISNTNAPTHNSNSTTTETSTIPRPNITGHFVSIKANTTSSTESNLVNNIPEIKPNIKNDTEEITQRLRAKALESLTNNTESTASTAPQEQSINNITSTIKENAVQDAIKILLKDKQIMPCDVLKTQPEKVYETTINENTTITEITNEQLINDMKARKLIKEDNGNTAVSVLLQDNTTHIIGTSKNGVKLAPLGQAYIFQVKTQIISNITTTTNSNVNTTVNFNIIVPPPGSKELFIEDGKHKHFYTLMKLIKKNYDKD